MTQSLTAHKPQLLWLDLEMTGLDANKDHILECAALLTDNELTVHATFDSRVLQCAESVLETMSPEVRKIHTRSGLLEAVRVSQGTLEELEQELLAFITTFAADRPLLCGNSIYQDRTFIARYMPQVQAKLHYRMIDVSSIKEFVRRRYPHSPYAFFKKPENHRAVSDIQETIAELKHYEQYFFISR